jgi:hypothetical protein
MLDITMSYNRLTPAQTPCPSLDQGRTRPSSPLSPPTTRPPSQLLSPAESVKIATALLDDDIYQAYGPPEPDPSPAGAAPAANSIPRLNHREEIRTLALEKALLYIYAQNKLSDSETQREKLSNENRSLRDKIAEVQHQNHELRNHINFIFSQLKSDEVEFRLNKMEEIKALREDNARLEDKLQMIEKEKLQGIRAMWQNYRC